MWDDVIEHFNDIETDFHEIYGVDFGDGVLEQRDWRWFKIRVEGLLIRDSRLALSLGLNNRQPSLF